MLASALLAKPDVLILDEPATGVDINGEQLLCELLEEIKSDMTIVMVSHDLPTAKAHADWVVCLNRQVVAEGPPKEIFRPAILAATFGLHQALEAGPEAASETAAAASETPATPAAAPPAEAPRPAGPAAASTL
jgi:zinc transport system ATP-binding protein